MEMPPQSNMANRPLNAPLFYTPYGVCYLDLVSLCPGKVILVFDSIFVTGLFRWPNLFWHVAMDVMTVGSGKGVGAQALPVFP